MIPAPAEKEPYMESFTRLTGVAAPLPMINVDTDMIIPKQFLKTIKRTGLGAHLFEDLRRDPDSGEEVDGFVLNRAPYRQASILVAGDNFGCGSSREHAPWALLDFGIRCVIAPGFADIFHGNCFKNGILPIALEQGHVDMLMEDAADPNTATLTVDLEALEIRRGSDAAPISFEVDPFGRRCLLEGLDDIALTLQRQEEIDAFEERHKTLHPWQ